MVSLIGSLADNKGALGRRYGEWAVSAPTIESAVAAAAMAQDELGHARSTYPVLAKLGVAALRRGPGRRPPAGVIAAELPDWASVIAANLVVDGILTTWVASARDSSIEPLAQRARKILQEEGAHRVHAEAWLQAHLRHRRRRPRAAAAAHRRDVGAGRALARARRPPRLPRRGGRRDGERRPGPRSARACATGWPAGWAPRARRPRSPTPTTGQTGTSSAADDRHAAHLPLL